jgi:hypothetical protein
VLRHLVVQSVPRHSLLKSTSHLDSSQVVTQIDPSILVVQLVA